MGSENILALCLSFKAALYSQEIVFVHKTQIVVMASA